jgi:hypothetical protein
MSLSLRQILVLSSSKQEEQPEKKFPLPKAASAVVASLLVAANYLDLNGTYLRGGNFDNVLFKNSILRQANFRHAIIDGARFIQADVRDLELGIWPDLIGHSDKV